MKTTCPSCHGKNFYVTEHNGKKYCFNCAYFENTNGVITEQKRSEHLEDIRQLYTEIANYYHSCLSTEHREYLIKRGINDASIGRFKIGYCPKDSHVLYIGELAREAGLAINNKPFLANRIIFPYWHDGTVTDMRGRLFAGEGDKYKSLFHGTYYRGADYSYNDTLSTANDVIITEGEIKTIVPTQYGLDVRGLPGIKANRYITLKPDQKIIICFDNQKRNRYELLRAIKSLAQRLQNVYVATLPLFGKEKQDIDGFVLDYGIDSFMRVINSALKFETWKEYARV